MISVPGKRAPQKGPGMVPQGSPPSPTQLAMAAAVMHEHSLLSPTKAKEPNASPVAITND